ncbi:MAG TPA: hypothetical protein VGC91_17105 [Pyrinomonadaceae bacterium]|jgi:hypothetical protein
MSLKKEISRKGAKAQRKARKEQVAFNNFAFLLCAFAPLRETFSLFALLFAHDCREF